MYDDLKICSAPRNFALWVHRLKTCCCVLWIFLV